MPEPLPETGVLANPSSGKFEKNEWKKERMNDTHLGFLILDEIEGAEVLSFPHRFKMSPRNIRIEPSTYWIFISMKSLIRPENVNHRYKPGTMAVEGFMLDGH